MEIAALTEQDLPALAKLFEQFRGETSSLDTMRATLAKLVENPDYVLLAAKQDDHLVGFAMGVICGELYGNGGPFMVAEDVIVHKDQRRTGVGSALMSTLEQRAVERDCCQIIFVTETDRTEAHRFYESLGYDPDAYKGFKKRLADGRQGVGD